MPTPNIIPAPAGKMHSHVTVGNLHLKFPTAHLLRSKTRSPIASDNLRTNWSTLSLSGPISYSEANPSYPSAARLLPSSLRISMIDATLSYGVMTRSTPPAFQHVGPAGGVSATVSRGGCIELSIILVTTTANPQPPVYFVCQTALHYWWWPTRRDQISRPSKE
jgi:hypothetical protein